MRAVKAVLTSAGALKRRYLNEREDVVVLRSICDVNLPKFLAPDVLLFNGIVSDLFPNTKLPNPDYQILLDAFQTICNRNNIQNVGIFKKKALQLYEMINCRHGVMIVGKTMAGKTICYQTLADTLTEVANQGSTEELPTSYYILNPKSVSIDELYGYSDIIS